jgi:undecaprenyl pyrophosphate synthase
MSRRGYRSEGRIDMNQQESDVLKKLLQMDYPEKIRHNQLYKSKRNNAINRILVFVNNQEARTKFHFVNVIVNYDRRRELIELVSGVFLNQSPK